MAVEERFSLEKAGKHFHNCLRDNNTDADIDEYLKGYEEINRMFPLLGRLFVFVQSDVQDKIDVCRKYLVGPDKEHYKTVKSMMEYEKKQNKHEKTDPPSCCRTLLRLHRALAYVSGMIAGIGTMTEEDGATQTVSRAAYDRTLSRHHTWLVRKAVHCAIYAIPRRKHLITLFAPPDYSISQAEAIMAQACRQCDKAFDVLEELYRAHGMLDLP